MSDSQLKDAPPASSRYVKWAWRKLLRRFVIVSIIAVALLYFFQDRVIYHPVRYPKGWQSMPTKDTASLSYAVTVGGKTWKNTSFYIPSRKAAARPMHLWVMFGGNASVALSWMDLVKQAGLQDSSAAFLLIDYPGYGLNEGHPHPDSILSATEAAYSALAAKLNTTTQTLDKDVSTLGHSLGCATSLQFAVRHPVRAVVLASPFTSTFDMAKHRAGWPLCYLLRDRFDNQARLRELLGRPNPPAIVIIHGDSDGVIPVTMGRQLASLSKEIIYLELNGIDHAHIPHEGKGGLLEAMQARP